MKREMLDQQNEILLYTDELRRRKQMLQTQMESTKNLFRDSNNRGIDSQRFGQIAKGLHAATSFEESNTRKFANCTGSLLTKLDSKLMAVSGPQNSLDILSTSDLSLVVNLNTDGKMPFCAIREGNLLIAGCTSGYLFTWNIDLGFQQRKCVRVSQKIS